MPELLITITSIDWIRLFLVYVHLIVCALALGLVLRTDWRFLTRELTATELEDTARWVTWALLLTWLTGLALLYRDTGLSPIVLASQPKLMLKLVCVLMLTLNGMVLHTISFPMIIDNNRLGLIQSVIVAMTGAFSTSHWLLAAFVGVSRPLAQLPLNVLFFSYGLYCLITLMLGILFTPLIKRRIIRLNLRSVERRDPGATWRRNRHYGENNVPPVHAFYDLVSDLHEADQSTVRIQTPTEDTTIRIGRAIADSEKA